jgi:hypothetical protein
VHIPKTAGTSFRAAAESSFGESRILRDYGPASEATSQSVKREVYDTDDKNGIFRALESDRAVLLAGHFPVQKYGRLLGLQNTVTIFRDPVEQVISHYRHAVAHHGYEGELLDFAKRDGIKNIQTRFLFKLDPALIGIIGLTESYRDSLAIINERWNWGLKHRRKNVSDRFDRKGIEISEEERFELEDINRDDRALYQRACVVLKNSLHCQQLQLAADTRGAICIAEVGKNVEGWAFDMHSEDPAIIALKLNGRYITKAKCDQPFAKLNGWKLPRGELVGFSLKVALNSGDVLEVEDVVTGLVLDKKIAAMPSR